MMSGLRGLKSYFDIAEIRLSYASLNGLSRSEGKFKDTYETKRTASKYSTNALAYDRDFNSARDHFEFSFLSGKL